MKVSRRMGLKFKLKDGIDSVANRQKAEEKVYPGFPP